VARGLRDRDGIVTREGLIFRVYGYAHPPTGYVCDVEYAPATIYHSSGTKALREGSTGRYYKFFEDRGLTFVARKYPRYQVYYRPLRRWLVGVPHRDIHEARRPGQALQRLLRREGHDELIHALKQTLHQITAISHLTLRDFGVFGSLLHDFYHPQYSDIDFTVVGKEQVLELRKVLATLYSERSGLLINEFTAPQTWSKDAWKFTNLSLSEYAWHQRRKLLYGTYVGPASTRRINVEFEPVKADGPSLNDYDANTQVHPLGWIEVRGRITEDADGDFMPAVYGFEVDDPSHPRADKVSRIVSYVEEYRMQVRTGERVFVAGHLERVTSLRSPVHQITLSYGPRYYEQTLKTLKG
jgi:predicted nucleotidyltransferase